jgi:hypothetical protein
MPKGYGWRPPATTPTNYRPCSQPQGRTDGRSTRTGAVHEQERELAQAGKLRNGRTPNSHQLVEIAMVGMAGYAPAASRLFAGPCTTRMKWAFFTDPEIGVLAQGIPVDRGAVPDHRPVAARPARIHCGVVCIGIHCLQDPADGPHLAPGPSRLKINTRSHLVGMAGFEPAASCSQSSSSRSPGGAGQRPLCRSLAMIVARRGPA